MKKILLGLLVLGSFLFSDVQAQTQTIRKATKHCEAAVAQHCAKEGGNCAKFCDAAYRKGRMRDKCHTECTADLRCKAKVPGMSDMSGNRELDALTSDQLMQCIAEERDPKNEKSGRRDIHFTDIMTPSLAKLLGVPTKLDIE